jgi:broad-specificity NMP kinase
LQWKSFFEECLFFVVLKKRPKKLFLKLAKKGIPENYCNEKLEIGPKKTAEKYQRFL